MALGVCGAENARASPSGQTEGVRRMDGPARSGVNPVSMRLAWRGVHLGCVSGLPLLPARLWVGNPSLVARRWRGFINLAMPLILIDTTFWADALIGHHAPRVVNTAGWARSLFRRQFTRNGTLCPLGGLRNPLWAPHSWPARMPASLRPSPKTGSIVSARLTWCPRLAFNLLPASWWCEQRKRRGHASGWADPLQLRYLWHGVGPVL